MYNNGVETLIRELSKTEAISVLGWYDPKTIGYCNILIKGFRELTEGMSKVTRSRFKKKLIDAEIIFEYNKVIMVNPYIFLPKEDKNVENCGFLTQRVWKYMVEDFSIGNDEIIEHAERLFGSIDSNDFITVGSAENSVRIEKFKEEK